MKEVALADPNLMHILQVCLDLPDEEVDQYQSITGEKYDAPTTAAALLLAGGPRWAILDADGDAIAVAGATSERPGVWRSWFLAREVAWTDYAEVVTDIARGLMSAMFHDYGARRLEVICLAKRAKARRWYERHVGLSYEGTLVAYSATGEDAAIYAKVRDW